MENIIGFYFAISGLIPRHKRVCTLAAAQVMQRLQRFGIKPDGIINFRTRSLRGAQTQASVQTNTTLKIPHGGSLLVLETFSPIFANKFIEPLKFN
jgi:hypothetical protein